MVEPTLPAVRPAGWNGPVSTSGSGWYEQFDSSFSAYDAPLLDAAEIDLGATVLSLGCGAGRLTRELARRAFAGRVLGLDPSGEVMRLAAAGARHEDLRNVAFLCADAQSYPFAENCFDVQVSRHGACCFANPSEAFGNLTSALRPGGRLVFLAWQPAERNEWVASISAAMGVEQSFPVYTGGARTLVYFNEPAPLRAVLESAGLQRVRATPVEAPVMLGRDVEEAMAFIATGFRWNSSHLGDRDAHESLAALRADVEAHNERGVRYGSAAWIVTAVRPRER